MKFVFENHEIDLDRRELKREDVRVAIEPQVFDLLVYLIRHRDRVVTKDDLIEGVWGGRIVSESALTSRISAARKAIGDNGGAQRLIRTIPRKGLRFIGEVRDEVSPSAAAAVALDNAPVPVIGLRQKIQFCTASDGARIAYATIGKGSSLVKTGNWMTHLEKDLESPIWRHLYRDLAKAHTLIRYDARGNGLSDWDVEEISFEAFVRDLEAVVDAAGVERFALLGISQGCAVSIAYAVRHPERVTHLVLYGGYAQGWARRACTEAEKQQAAAMLTLVRLGWGQENPAFRQLFTSQFMPEGTKEQADWFNELQRVSTSAENAARNLEANGDADVTDLLPKVAVPTLVMHAREDARVPFETGRRMAAAIPGARFVPLQSRNHLILEDESAFARFIEEITSFLET